MMYEYERNNKWFYKCDCGWEGDLDNLSELGIDGPCCPECGEEEFEDGDTRQE